MVKTNSVSVGFSQITDAIALNDFFNQRFFNIFLQSYHQLLANESSKKDLTFYLDQDKYTIRNVKKFSWKKFWTWCKTTVFQNFFPNSCKTKQKWNLWCSCFLSSKDRPIVLADSDTLCLPCRKICGKCSSFSATLITTQKLPINVSKKTWQKSVPTLKGAKKFNTVFNIGSQNM